MCKKREESANEDKILDLDRKIAHYEEMMAKLDKKIHLSSYEDLQRRKIFLHFDIEKRKTDIQNRIV